MILVKNILQSWRAERIVATQPQRLQIRIAEPSVKSLLIELRANGQLLGTATSFAADAPRGPVLITNRHIVTGRHPKTGRPLSGTGAVPDEIRIYHNSAIRFGEWVSRIEPLFFNGRPLWVEHPALRAQADFVALPLTQLCDVQLYPYTLGIGDPAIIIKPAEVVSVVGFPFGLTAGGALAIWATGFVATDPDIDYDNLPIFLIDCRSRPGQSGSAVIAHRTGGAVSTEQGTTVVSGGIKTKFLGIYSGRVNAESDLGFVWKAAAIRQLVNAIV
jgi:hypothetical protein